MVRLLQLRIRRLKDLRVCNIAAVLGRRARGRRELLTQSVLPAAVLPAISTLSVLIGLQLPQKLRQLGDIRRNPAAPRRAQAVFSRRWNRLYLLAIDQILSGVRLLRAAPWRQVGAF